MKANGRQGARARTAARAARRMGLLGMGLALLGNAAAEGRNFSLYSDRKARRAEDLITVMVVENARATNDTKTKTDKKNEVALDVTGGSGPLSFIPGMGLGGASSAAYDGKGQTARAGEVKATVAARIMAVYDNGNLLIQGSKEVSVNEETEVLRVSGIVRPEDISSDNTIYSFKIADAKIEYSGRGDSHNAHRPGPIARFFNWIF